MKTFSQRLAICVKLGGLTQGDLHWWFNRSYSTTASWLVDGREPRGPSGDESRERLTLLEKLVTQRRGFPVPQVLSNTERPAYIKSIFNAHSAGVPRKRSA